MSPKTWGSDILAWSFETFRKTKQYRIRISEIALQRVCFLAASEVSVILNLASYQMKQFIGRTARQTIILRKYQSKFRLCLEGRTGLKVPFGVKQAFHRQMMDSDKIRHRHYFFPISFPNTMRYTAFPTIGSRMIPIYCSHNQEQLFNFAL